MNIVCLTVRKSTINTFKLIYGAHANILRPYLVNNVYMSVNI